MRGLTLSQRADLSFLTQKGRVWIMGVLNVTPDSFYPDSRTLTTPQALAKAECMVREGADLLDVGGESTRPGAAEIAETEERKRVLPVLDALHARWPELPISVDTQKAAIAHEAIARGARVINDISALRHDPEMAAVVADAGCPVVLMHMQGTPQMMQQAPRYSHLMDELKKFFEERMTAASRAGIAEDNILLDPGIGFGKTLEHNVTLLRELNQLTSIGRPILVGVSRKSFIGKMLGSTGGTRPVEDRLEGTLAASLWAVQQGANGLRVHDVAATRQSLSVWESLRRSA
jgi:dihydropteroate synthase